MTSSNADDLTLDEALAGLPEDFAFFRERWVSDLQPQLAELEVQRVAAVEKSNRFRMFAALGALLVGGGGFTIFHNPVPVVFGLVVGGMLWAWGEQDLKKLGEEAKLTLVHPVARQFDMIFNHIVQTPPVISRLRNLGLVPSWDRAKFEDRLTGQRAGAPFEFFEAHLEEKRTTRDSKGRTSTSWVTVFRGQCLAVTFPKQFQGVTKVFRDSGMFNSLVGLGQTFGGRAERVRLEDPKFEKAFEVYSTDQIEARYILTPDFMERLTALEEVFHSKKLRCAFSGGEMFLAVEGENLFEPGSMRRPMDDHGRLRDILQDFAAVFLLIDAMSQRHTPDALRNSSS